MQLNADQSLEKIHQTSNHTLSLINYPPVVGNPEKVDRNPAHSDMGTLTLLFQDGVPGLEVAKVTTKTLYDQDEFDAVDPDTEYVFVTAGYLLECWTNRKWRAVKHRVVTPEADATRARNSIAFFGAPDTNTIIRRHGRPDLHVGMYQEEKRELMHS